MVKPIVQLYPVIHSDSEEDRIARRPLGRDSQAYQETLKGMNEIVVGLDELGFWGVTAIEHHFWSEGYQIGPCPGIYNAHWASITKNINVGQLGYVMSTQSPIRVAEEIAVLDHLAQGRVFAGFARGYQSRWTNILGQLTGARATKSPNAINEGKGSFNFTTGAKTASADAAQMQADDDRNRRIFEESVDLVIKAWTCESIELDGEFWKIPFPYDTGVDDWQPAHSGITARMGARGEVDENNAIRQVSVVPSPYSAPHPPVFVGVSGSPQSIEYAALNDFNVGYFTSVARALAMGKIYVDTSAAQGRTRAMGQNQALIRWMMIGDTEADAREKLVRYDGEIFKNMYAGMSPQIMSNPDDLAESMMGTGLWITGSVSQVRDHFISHWKQFPADYCILVSHYAQISAEEQLAQYKIFMEEIKPALDELTPERDPEAELVR